MASNGASVCTETPAEEQAPRKAMPEVGGNGIRAAKSKPVAVSLGDGAMLTAEQVPADMLFASPVRGGGVPALWHQQLLAHRGCAGLFIEPVPFFALSSASFATGRQSIHCSQARPGPFHPVVCSDEAC